MARAGSSGGLHVCAAGGTIAVARSSLSRSRGAAGGEVTDGREAAGWPRRGREERRGEREGEGKNRGAQNEGPLRRLPTLKCWRQFPRMGTRLKGTAPGSGHNLSFRSVSCKQRLSPALESEVFRAQAQPGSLSQEGS